ncbi:MAG: 2-aminoethylphosphonate--pyruvate transaminase [Marinobacter sp.]|nr:2-aminoethylphosphonate--pyruvate transaminase [Marinobacter sp.]
MKKHPYLLTPGPLTTSETVKMAALQDWGSWDDDFNQLSARVCDYLLGEANAKASHECVLMQGSGTFAVEATLGSLLDTETKTLVLMNGAYGKRLASILARMGLPHTTLDKGDYLPPLANEVRTLLQADTAITHVALIHCETSSGILNPLEAIARVVAEEGRQLIIDAMSSFGALPIDAAQLPFLALISSANKCFEGIPGFGFIIVEREALKASAGRSRSLSLDLHDQWSYMQKTGQWRYTPPTHVVAAFLQAIEEHAAEGRSPARLARYTRNRDRLVTGMRRMGFHTLLDDHWLSPIIVTFLAPEHPEFDFKRFYQAVKARGFLLYPGKLTEVDSFRIGCIGQLFDEQIDQVLRAIAEACHELGLPLAGTAEARRVEAVIMDMAGTCVDFGSRAPIQAFIALFEEERVPVTAVEARIPMGKEKREHIQALLAMPRIRESWVSVKGQAPASAEVDRLYHRFTELQKLAIAQNTQLIPGTLALVDVCNRQAIKVGLNTGYSGEMVASLLPEMQAQGLQPGSVVCATDVPAGRPAPWMCLQNARELGVSGVQSCIKVDDTAVGIAEGRNAGMWTVAVAVSGNELGLSLEEWQALTDEEQQSASLQARQTLTASGAHYVIDSVAELPAIIARINQRLAAGDQP